MKPIHPFFPGKGFPVPVKGAPACNLICEAVKCGQVIEGQIIELSRGCPNNCEWCCAPYAATLEDVELFAIPNITHRGVGITDMNFLFQPNIVNKIKELGELRLDGKKLGLKAISGLDYRFCTQEIADAMKKADFQGIALAWDGSYDDQIKIRKSLKMFTKAGYKAKDICIYILYNFKISLKDCMKKLDLLKIWGVRVFPSMFNGGIKVATPGHWTIDEIKEFREQCRRHNNITIFETDRHHETKRKKKAGELSIEEIRRKHL